jgi:hypothetical protein
VLQEFVTLFGLSANPSKISSLFIAGFFGFAIQKLFGLVYSKILLRMTYIRLGIFFFSKKKKKCLVDKIGILIELRIQDYILIELSKSYLDQSDSKIMLRMTCIRLDIFFKNKKLPSC